MIKSKILVAGLVLAATTVYPCVSAKAQNVESEIVLKYAISSGKPTLLEFEAPWCVSCSRMRPLIEAAAKEFSGKVNVISVDVDKNENLTKRYKIHSIPVQILLDGSGKEVKRHYGGMERNELSRLLKGSFRSL